MNNWWFFIPTFNQEVVVSSKKLRLQIPSNWIDPWVLLLGALETHKHWYINSSGFLRAIEEQLEEHNDY